MEKLLFIRYFHYIRLHQIVNDVLKPIKKQSDSSRHLHRFRKDLYSNTIYIIFIRLVHSHWSLVVFALKVQIALMSIIQQWNRILLTWLIHILLLRLMVLLFAAFSEPCIAFRLWMIIVTLLDDILDFIQNVLNILVSDQLVFDVFSLIIQFDKWMEYLLFVVQ